MTWSSFVTRMKDPRAIAILVVVGIVTSVVIYKNRQEYNFRATANLFTNNYPASPSFAEELKTLRRDQKLSTEDEFAIQQTVKTVSASMEMPPAILWCLMFQESRLDHLLGIEGERPIYGLGQFSHFSFYEINHQLTRYSDTNLVAMKALLGRDVRPIGPIARPVTNLSSYYFIPTAVVSTGSFLHNRFLQLRKALRWQGIDPDPELLWLYSTMAYNKGTRTVLSLFNELRSEEGVESVRASLIDPRIFNRIADNSELADSALRRIWPKDRAHWYAKELTQHIQQIRQCAMNTQFSPNPREITNEK